MVRDVETLNGPATGGLKEYEEAIRQIREVMAVRVVAGSRGEIDEIHVLAGSGRGPKQIVRDIESSLMAQFGLSVDHKKISVAQVEENSPIVWGSGRLRLLGVRYAIEGPRADAEVRVEFDDVVHTGRAAAAGSHTGRLRVAGEAALAAVGEYFNSNHQLALEDVAILEFRGGHRVAFTLMSLLAHGTEETLVGTCLVRGTEADAVVRSVLDALNRRFAMIVRKPNSRNGSNGPAGGDGD